MKRREPDFHELMQPPHDALLLQRLSQRLRLLERQGETPSARSEIDAALESPWWGLRQLAIRAIGSWGGRANRAWLTERARRPSLRHRAFWKSPRGSAERWRHVETVTCREAVVSQLDGKDADWLLDLWFAGYTEFQGLHDALGRLPATTIEERLGLELAGGESGPVEAAMWLVYYARQLHDREDLYGRLTSWPDPKLADLARRLRWMEERSARLRAERAVRTASRRPG